MELDQLIAGIEKLLGYMFGGQPPVWLIPAISWCIGVGLLLAGLAFLLGRIKIIWTEYIQPIRYKPEEVRRRSRRQMFADFMEAEMRRLNTLEAWSDNRFAELEAEVEVEGGRTLFGLFKMGSNGIATIRKEKSLSKALEKSAERLILVEGEPGSGKSVALRHLTQTLARRSSDSKNVKSLVPLYVNLKQLRRASGQKIDQNLIEDFIHKSLNRINDRDIEDFLSEEFRRGIEDGTWLFLFDSFDEIPDVLSSTEADNTIRDYAEALSDFLHGMNNCRGIVASREYKGPRFLGWPKFRILPLALDRKIQLIKRTGLSLNSQSIIVDGISQPVTDFKSLTGNPMFLNLLCEFMRKNETPEFPKHTHNVFNDYVWKRLTRDEERLKQRFSKTPSEIREAAEKLAYCMTADTGIGLSPTMEQLSESTKRQNLDLLDDFDTYINAIEYLKLARIEPSLLDGHKYFTFAHRRFQEYFATAVVMREPNRINLSALLNDARWRETAVVILQTQSIELIFPIFSEAQSKLLDARGEFEQKSKNIKTISKKFELPSYLFGSLARNMFEKMAVSEAKIKTLFEGADTIVNPDKETEAINFPLDWPKNLYHILGILQDGLTSRYYLIPETLQKAINDILLLILENGSLDDRKWAIDVVGSATLDVVERAVDIGFSSPGTWIRNSAFLQVARLREIPNRFSRYIISNLLESAQKELIFKRRHEIYAQFARFADNNYSHAAALVVWMPITDFLLTLIAITLVIGLGIKTSIDIFQLIGVALIVFLGWLIRWQTELLNKSFTEVFSVLSESMEKSIRSLIKNRKVKKEQVANIVLPMVTSIYGSFISFVGIGLFFGTLSGFLLYSTVVNDKVFVIGWLLLAILTQAWVLVATFEIFQLKRISSRWLLLYFLYPLFFCVLLPYLAAVYLLEQIYILSRANMAIKELRNRRNPKRIVTIILSKYIALAAPFALVATTPIWLALVMLLNNRIGAIVLGGAIIFLEVLFILYWIFTGVGFVTKEQNQFKLLMATLKPLDVIKLVNIIESFSSKRYRVRIIRLVLDKQFLETSSINITKLRNVIAFIQTTLKGSYSTKHFEQLISIDKELALAFGFIDSNHFRIDNNWDDTQLDLLCKLLEQIQQLSKTNA